MSYLFANFGSDHTAIVEAYALARGEAARTRCRLVLCPHEMVALSAAQGYAQVTGQAQAVLVHVECGTQSLGGAVHNVSRGRVPVLIFAGASPLTQEGELPGSRNEFIHWLQDTRRPARDRPRLRQVRQRDPHRAQRSAARPPRAADRAQRAGRPGLPDRGARGHGGDGPARRAGAPASGSGGRRWPRRRWRRRDRRDRRRAGRRRRTAGRHVVPGPRPRRGRRADRAVRARGHRRDRVGADADELPGRPSAVPGQPVEQHRPEPGARRRRRGAGGRQRRAVDPGHQPPRARRPDLRHSTSTR